MYVWTLECLNKYVCACQSMQCVWSISPLAVLGLWLLAVLGLALGLRELGLSSGEFTRLAFLEEETAGADWRSLLNSNFLFTGA